MLTGTVQVRLIWLPETASAVSAVGALGGSGQVVALARLLHGEAPTLLIVGGRDEAVIKLNQQAYARLRCEKELRIVPGATHLFEEPGTLEEVARLAAEWFQRHLQARSSVAGE